MVLVSSHLLLVLGVDVLESDPVIHQFGVLLLPALELVHLLLVGILLFNSCLLFLASGRLSLLFELLLRQDKLLMVHNDLIELLPGLISVAPPINNVLLLVVLSHKDGQLVPHHLQFIVVNDEEQIGEHF